MKIERIDLWHVAVPLPAPFYPSWIPGFRQEENRFDLLRLRTSDGIEGWSAVPAMAKERAGWGTLLGSYVLGERADDIASVRQRIRELGYLGHRAGGLIEPACWDIIGKARGKPVHEILGGTRGGRVKLYASTGEIKSGPERVDEVQQRVDEGFDCVKLRVHADTLEEDVAQLRAVREAFPDLKLGVDANMGWRVAAIADCAKWDWQRAADFCKAAEELDFTWVEEPLPNDDFAGLARLRESTKVTIAGAELNNYGIPDFRHLVEKGCFGWYQPDAVMVGGISETWAIVQMVKASGAQFSPHTWTNGIGFAINLQIFAALDDDQKHLEYPLNPPGWMPAARDGLLTAPWLADRGSLDIPTRPGLGFEIDPRQLKKYGKRFYTGTKTRVAVTTVLDRGPKLAAHLGGIRTKRLDKSHADVEAKIRSGGDPAMDSLRELVDSVTS